VYPLTKLSSEHKYSDKIIGYARKWIKWQNKNSYGNIYVHHYLFGLEGLQMVSWPSCLVKVS
jgi:hypothetical protein